MTLNIYLKEILSVMKTKKEEIIELRRNGKTYRQISIILNTSINYTAFVCRENNLKSQDGRIKISDSIGDEMNTFYKSHSILETMEKFKVSRSTVMRLTDKKRILLNEDEKKERSYTYVKKYRHKLKRMAIEYKGGKCYLCGYDRCDQSFDFHHLYEKEKDFNISRKKNSSFESIKDELDKCVLVCSNCHREIHSGYVTL